MDVLKVKKEILLCQYQIIINKKEIPDIHDAPDTDTIIWFYIVFSMAFSQSNDWENPSYTWKGKKNRIPDLCLFTRMPHF